MEVLVVGDPEVQQHGGVGIGDLCFGFSYWAIQMGVPSVELGDGRSPALFLFLL